MKSRAIQKRSASDPELEALKAELDTAKADLQTAYHQFDLAVEPELVESCVYQISAVQARCNYLIRAIKARQPAVAAALPPKEDVTWT